VARVLEAPNGSAADWDILYLARGDDELVPHRPIFTGDVFKGVQVQPPRAEAKVKTVMVIQHPCAMRPDGVALAESILVAEVRRFPVLPPDKWDTSGKIMPLPDLLPDVASNRRHQAALFDNTYHVHPSDLLNRTACLSPRGVNLLLQRWVYHSSRVIVPSFDFDAAISHVYEQADIIEEWCGIAIAGGRGLDEAINDAHEWLQEIDGGLTREKALQTPGRRSLIRRKAREAAATWRAPGEMTTCQPGDNGGDVQLDQAMRDRRQLVGPRSPRKSRPSGAVPKLPQRRTLTDGSNCWALTRPGRSGIVGS
jgi:hypothetical protein